MQGHRFLRGVGILLIIVAIVYLLAAVAGGLWLGNRGFGSGWGTGWTGWLTLPLAGSAVLAALTLLVFGTMLFMLAKIDDNVAVAQQRRASAAAKPRPQQAVALPVETPVAPAAPSITAAAPIFPAEPVAEPIAEADARAQWEEPVLVETEAVDVAPAGTGVVVEEPALSTGELPTTTTVLPTVEMEGTGEEWGTTAPIVAGAAVAAGRIDDDDIDAPRIDLESIDVPPVEPAEVELPRVDVAGVEASATETALPTVEFVAGPDASELEAESMPPVAATEVEMERVNVSATVPQVETRLPEIEVSDTPALVAERSPEEAALAAATGIPEEEAGVLHAAPVTPAEKNEMAELRAEVASLKDMLAQLTAALLPVAAPAPSATRGAEPMEEPPALGDASRLPGTDEVARIAAEMNAAGALRARPAQVEMGTSETPAELSASVADNLEMVAGLGPIYAKRLREMGVTTFAQLAEAPYDVLDKVTHGNLERVIKEDWRGQARRLAQKE